MRVTSAGSSYGTAPLRQVTSSAKPNSLSSSTSRTVRRYQVQDLGWVYCQGGGYFGGFNDGLGQGVYRGDYHVEGEVWDVSHPTQITDDSGRTFEFDHAWAENFTRLTSDGRAGLAHFECVVITEAQEWSAHPGKAGSHD